MNDEFERLFTMYDGGHLNRRQLLQGLLGLGLGSGVVSTRSDASASDGLREPLFHAHTINHVTIRAADVPRSKAFYQSLTGLAVRAEDKDFCEFRLEHGFLGLYASKPDNVPATTTSASALTLSTHRAPWLRSSRRCQARNRVWNRETRSFCATLMVFAFSSQT